MEPIKMVFHEEEWEWGQKMHKKIKPDRGFAQNDDASVP